MSYQLNLLSGQLEPLASTKRRQAFPKNVIKDCTTQKAAILLDVSVSTLYRARQSGQSYKNAKSGWIAKPIGPNRWHVVIPPTHQPY